MKINVGDKYGAHTVGRCENGKQGNQTPGFSHVDGKQYNALNGGNLAEDYNQEIREKGAINQGVGFFNVSYNPEDGRRSSASVAYLHPIIRGDEKRPNLTILTNGSR